MITYSYAWISLSLSLSLHVCMRNSTYLTAFLRLGLVDLLDPVSSIQQTQQFGVAKRTAIVPAPHCFEGKARF